MTDEINTQQGTGADTAKLWIAVAIVVAGLAGYYLVTGGAWLRWLCVAGSLIVAALVVAWSSYGTTLKQFMLDSRVELRKIVWPNRQETGLTTLVVFAFVIVAGMFFWILDLILAWATRALTGQGG